MAISRNLVPMDAATRSELYRQLRAAIQSGEAVNVIFVETPDPDDLEAPDAEPRTAHITFTGSEGRDRHTVFFGRTSTGCPVRLGIGVIDFLVEAGDDPVTEVEPLSDEDIRRLTMALSASGDISDDDLRRLMECSPPVDRRIPVEPIRFGSGRVVLV